MTDHKADRVLSVSLSIFVHGLIVAGLAWGWWKYRQAPPTPQSLAIEGTVVNNLNPPPPAPRPEPVSPAPPTPDEQTAQKAHEEEQRKEAEEKAQEQKRAAEAQAQQQRVQEEKAAAEKAAAEKAAADKAAEEQRKQEAARQAKAEADRKAQELAQQKQAEQRAQRVADLKAQIAAEEHQAALQSSPARTEYLSLITARINHAWHRPPNARSGVRCTVHITQIPGGEVTHVSVTGCNGDESVRQSVENAAYSASPLPAPGDPALFDPNINVTFAPDD
jgi:colicin import membrane protein